MINYYALGSTTHRLQVTVASLTQEDRTMREKSFVHGKNPNIRMKSAGKSSLKSYKPHLNKPKTILPFIVGVEKSRVTIAKQSQFLKACFEFWS